MNRCADEPMASVVGEAGRTGVTDSATRARSASCSSYRDCTRPPIALGERTGDNGHVGCRTCRHPARKFRAQSTTAFQECPTMTTATTVGDIISSDQVEGTKVFNAAGDKLGSVDELMIDKRSGQVLYAVLEFG